MDFDEESFWKILEAGVIWLDKMLILKNIKKMIIDRENGNDSSKVLKIILPINFFEIREISGKYQMLILSTFITYSFT